MCEQVQVLHFNLHMPLEFLVFCGALLQRWLYKLLLAQKAMLKLVYLNKLVTLHTGCPRRNVPDFGRVFLMLNYTNITQNTYIQS